MAVFVCAAFLVLLQLITPLTTAESVTMPPECENMTYCTFKGKYYPQDEINKLNNNNQLSEMVFSHEGINDIGHRWSDGTDITEDLCPSTEHTDPIYYIVDWRNRTRVVVQLKDVLEQVFSLQECDNPGTVDYSASQITRKKIESLEMYCKNINYQYEFFVLSDDRTRLEKAYNRNGLPVYCACRYKKSKYTRSGDFIKWNKD